MGFTDRVRKWFGSSTPDDFAGDSSPWARAAKKEAKEERARPPQRITKIERPVLRLICEVARESHPNEFGGSLRAEGDTVTEIMLVPATIGGARHAILPLFNLPVDMSIVGTVHSHPSPYAIPSDADLQLFRNYGHTHIIIANPYTETTWRAYDHAGRNIRLEIID